MSTKKRIRIAALIALGLLVLTYFVGNLPYSFMGEKMFLKKASMLGQQFRKEKEDEDSLKNVLFVNVAYDKELKPYKDTLMGWCGNAPVTDRHKLLKLLHYLEEQEEAEQEKDGSYYKYILLDVFFEDGVTTQWDEELFTTILSMPRVIIPYRENDKIADNRLMEKAYLASYSQFIQVAGFTKYSYFIKTEKGNWEKTIPAEMFEEMTGRKIRKFGPLYFEGCHLAKRSCFLPLDIRPSCWSNLGTDLLGDTLKFSDSTYYIGDGLLYLSPNLAKNMFIVIGSDIPQGDDMHSTFRGEMAGAALCYNAFYSMAKNQFRISFAIVVLLFLVYFGISLFILSNGKETILLSRWFAKLNKGWKILVFFLLSFLGSFTILKLTTLFIFVFWGKVIETFFVSFVLSTILSIIKFNKQFKS